MAEDAAAEEAQSLKTEDVHGSGLVSAGWLTKPCEKGAAILTAGADGKLAHRQLQPSGPSKDAEVARTAITAMDISPDRSTALVVHESRVQLVSLPSMKATRIASMGMTAHCCCWSRNGELFLVACDQGQIKLGRKSDKGEGQIMQTMRLEAFVRGLAFDPDGKYVAAATADGKLRLLELKEGLKQHKEETHKVSLPRIDESSPTTRLGVAWHPDGSLLAVAGKESDVVLLERYNWSPQGYLSGSHSGVVRTIAFSPNGLYVATGGEDCKVVVWRLDLKMQVSVRTLPSPPSTISWHPAADMLLCGTTSGSYGIWPNTVPDKKVRHLPEPYMPIDEVERLADAQEAAAAEASAEDDMFDDDDDEGGAAVVRRRGLRRGAAAADGEDSAAAGGAPDSLADIIDQLDEALQETANGGGPGGRLNPGAWGGQNPNRVVALAPKPRRPQGPIQPGSTPEGEGEEEGGAAARFLAYNQLGCVVSKAADGQSLIEVLFHDTSKHRLQPRFTDLFGFTAASLGPAGVAYISPAAGEDRPSMLMYRAFESWSGEKSWTVALPAGEEALVVAAGSSVVAVATDKQYLRLYSLTGRQLSITSLQGPAVALAAAGTSRACQQQLALVYAQGPPEALHHTQQLAYTVLDVSRCSEVASGQVVLSQGARLTWLAFSAEGLLVAMDSVGVLRVRTPDWGGCWVPVLDAAGAKAGCGSEHLWPVSLQADSLTAVVTSKQAPYPQVLPLPMHTQVPLSLPLAPAEAAPAELEQQALLQGMLLAHTKSLAASDPDADVTQQQQLHDATVLRQFKHACEHNKQARALELAGTISSGRGLEGALKVANHFSLNVLAEHVQGLVEEWEWQQQQAAAAATAAAAAAAAQVPYGDEEDHWEAAAAAGGDEDDKLGQADQASQFQSTDSASNASKAAAAAGGGGQRSSKLAPAFAGRAGGAAATAGSSGVVVGLKRKPAGGAGGVGGCGVKPAAGANPFSRKRLK